MPRPAPSRLSASVMSPTCSSRPAASSEEPASGRGPGSGQACPAPASAAARRPPTKPVAPAMRVLGAIPPRYPSAPRPMPGCEAGSVRIHVLERSQRVESADRAGLCLLRRRQQPGADDAALAAFRGDLAAAGSDGGRAPCSTTGSGSTGCPCAGRPGSRPGSRRGASSTIQERGPYSLWEHTHLFEADGEGLP